MVTSTTPAANPPATASKFESTTSILHNTAKTSLATTSSPTHTPTQPTHTPTSHRRHHRNFREIVVQLIAGGVAGAASRTITSPLERIKILFQVQNAPQARNVPGGLVLGTLIRVYREEGIRGYFKGNGTNCVRIIPYSAVQFAVYEYVKSALLAGTDRVELKTDGKLFAGALAGIVSVATTYPLDIARTRLSLMQLVGVGVAANGGPGAGTPTTMMGVVRYIYREEGGLMGLYRGMSPTTLGVAPYVALNFTFYESMKGLVDKDGRPPSVAYKLFCGGFAGAMAQTLTYPLDLIRRRFQVMNLKAEAGGFAYHYSSTGDAFRQIIQHEGLRGLYKGCLPNYLKVVPAIAVSFVSYETVKQLLSPDIIH